MTPNAPWLTNNAGRCPVGLLGGWGATILPFGRPMPLKWPPHSTMAVPAGAGGFVAATAEEQQKAAPWGGLDLNSRRPLQLFRWAASLNLNSVPVFQHLKSLGPFEQAQQPEARPVTHTSYRKSCLRCLEIGPGRSSAPGSCQFSALVATKLCVALFWPRAVSSGTQRRKAKPPLAMLADALRACPCVSRGADERARFRRTRSTHATVDLQARPLVPVLPGLSVGGRSVRGSRI